MTIEEAKILVQSINDYQKNLQVISNDDLRDVVKTESDNIIAVYAAVKEFARRLTIGDVTVSATDFDKSLEQDGFDFIELNGGKAIYHNTWSVMGTKYQWEMIHYDEQLLAGVLLHYGVATEMATGEGKTLVATLPAAFNALSHKGVHIMTVNSYLSKRDYEITRPLYSFFEITSGCIEYWLTHEKNRKEAYNADITFGTNSEFVFDYLCDHLVLQPQDIIQREHTYAIIDELDSLLIDNAVDPHVISGSNLFNQGKQYLLWKNAIQELLHNPSLYEVDKVNHHADFTTAGIEWLNKRPEKDKQDEIFHLSDGEEKTKYWQNVRKQLLRAYTLYQRDIDYIIYDGRVVIIDSTTGRRKDTSRWEYGLHTAMEVKESVCVQSDSNSTASISIKNFFRLYDKIAGMSGTIMSVSDELYAQYGLETASIPTHRPMIRKDYALRVFKNSIEKYNAIAKYIIDVHRRGRPVLVGCRDILQAKEVAMALKNNSLEITILDANDFGLEAYIISQAGKSGAITVSTSMAGRGTDIKLDEQARNTGGLAVVAADLFYSQRVDMQLKGRAGRQGDPGSSVAFISLDDFLVGCLNENDQQILSTICSNTTGNELKSKEVIPLMYKAQSNRDLFYTIIREKNARKDDMIAPQRAVFYGLRNDVLTSDDVARKFVSSLFSDDSEIALYKTLISFLWEKVRVLIKKMHSKEKVKTSFTIPLSCHKDPYAIVLDWRYIEELDYFQIQFQRQVILQSYDKAWSVFVKYLSEDLDDIQIDNLKVDFDKMDNNVKSLVKDRLLYSSIPINEKEVQLNDTDTEQQNATIRQSRTQLERTALCPCGSGKLFSQCHGMYEHKTRRR